MKIRSIRNMRELDLIKKNLEYRQSLYEENIAKNSAKIIDNITVKIKDMAFDLGMSMLVQLISGFKKRKK